MTINFKGGISSIGGISTGPEIVAGPGPFAPNAADFDGSDDRLFHTGALSTITDSKQGLVSVWFKPGIASLSGRIIHISDGGEETFAKLDIALSGNEFSVVGRPAGFHTVPVLFIQSISAFPTADVWVHVMASWDLGAGPITQLYVNNVSDISVDTVSDGIIDYNFGDTAIGSFAHTFGSPWNGCLGELYFTNEFLNLDDPDNRAKFISGGIPVDLGSNGSTPTGTQPILYFSGDGTAFPTNLGSGGSFTVENGPLTDCADGPSLA